MHAYLTLHPVADVLPTEWLSAVGRGPWLPYLSWLEGLRDGPPAGSLADPGRQEEVVRRWAAALGPDNVTVVVADENGPQRLFAALEEMFDLRPGTLVLGDEPGRAHLSCAEAVLLEDLHRQLQERGPAQLGYLDQYGEAAMRAWQALPAAAVQPPCRVPEEVVSQLAHLGRELVRTLEQLGIPVLGEPQHLAVAVSPEPATVPPPLPDHVTAETAAGLALAILSPLVGAQGGATTSPDELSSSKSQLESLRAECRELRDVRKAMADRRATVDDVSSARLLGSVFRRGLRRTAARVGLRR